MGIVKSIDFLVKSTDIVELEFHLDYLEIMLEMFQKREADTSKIQKEITLVQERIEVLKTSK